MAVTETIRSRLSQTARFLLILHGLFNICQGIYSVTKPQAWAARAGNSFKNTPDHAVQAIGLGSIGIGWYQFVFACQNNQALFIATIMLRLVYAGVVATWGDQRVVAYEFAVWLLANAAAYL
ncbi:hypothetical protein N0V94_009673 [Neodidymelliopsis sp. IMI 364377]|nr:hypothetical protein N0V94_009673 [Neodidymelliopsis sp. IMI 364377]